MAAKNRQSILFTFERLIDLLRTSEMTSTHINPHDHSLEEKRQDLIRYIHFKLRIAGVPGYHKTDVPGEVIEDLRQRYRESHGNLSPASRRVQDFIDDYFLDLPVPHDVKLPGIQKAFVLDRPGLAAELSVPEGSDYFESDIVKSYRLIGGQGVIHNPKNDRRTTDGVFHIAEGGMPVPSDKRIVPKAVAANLLRAALHPPKELLRLPFTAEQDEPFECFVSLLTRAIVVPEVAGFSKQRKTEIEFLAPGNLISNLDFIERIFGNYGDPHLLVNDMALDVEGWTGTSGFVILAPHLIHLTKKELGLPRFDEASVTPRQRRDGMCWETEGEFYNKGQAFKLAIRDSRGIMVTVIADNYYGYCKKEVKTQISYAANLIGHVEEEHAGGAIVYPRWDLGKTFNAKRDLPKGRRYTFEDAKRTLGDRMRFRAEEGYGVDDDCSDVYFLPETVVIDMNDQEVVWTGGDIVHKLPLDPAKTYVMPSGYKVNLERNGDIWRLVGTVHEGTFCHKPSTVSGGGKSEIAKPISDQIRLTPFFVSNFKDDMERVRQLLFECDEKYTNRHLSAPIGRTRPILSQDRSLGSVINLLTPSPTKYHAEYNEWLETIPHYIRQFVYMVKRFYRGKEHGRDGAEEDRWHEGFSVDIVNDEPKGNILKYNNIPLQTAYMRVGYTPDDQWRMFSLRADFVPSVKLQQEDDITASVVVPVGMAGTQSPNYGSDHRASFKIVSSQNPEMRLFQRPDDAITRGYDKLTEEHLAGPDNFLSNFEPLTPADAVEMLNHPIDLSAFTEPMQRVIQRASVAERGYFASSADPRVVDDEGTRSQNPRYLQTRPDLLDSSPWNIANVGEHLFRRAPVGEPIPYPVNAILSGRRLNPPDEKKGVRSLAVYNPIHYQETPELFMELISSLTGKSPSTTGAGSEGALTKGPFNALLPIVDINNALVSHILTNADCFITAAGHVGPNFRVDHDISMVIPEIWARMEVHERRPEYLKDQPFLEKCEDFEHNGKLVLASRLGYRINEDFVRTYFGTIFDDPTKIFTRNMLRPEEDIDGRDAFADGMDNIVGTQRKIASLYFEDKSVDLACPPIRALLHIMRDGKDEEGRRIEDPSVREMFTLSYLLEAPWYEERLKAQQAVDRKFWTRHRDNLDAYLANQMLGSDTLRNEVQSRKNLVLDKLAKIDSSDYLDELKGCLGADPSVL